MTYTGSSPIMGRGSATAAQIQQWFVTHNPNAPQGLGDAVIAECQPVGVNSDLVAAQIAHETGYWTSQIANQKNNPAGLGAENDNPLGKALTFPTPQVGIHAQVAHLLTYTLGSANPLKAADPRYQAAASAGYLGIATTLDDLDGRWAVPGDGYGAAIARLANELVGTAVAAPATPTQADIGYPVTVRWARDQGPARQLSDILWFIVHDTEGGAPGSGDAEYLLHPSNTIASAHAVILKNGELWFEVPLGVTAWTPGNDDVAVRSINVELSGHASEGFTEDQYRSLAAFFRWCVTQGCTFPPKYVGKEDVPGICGHQDVADPNHPGQWGGASHHTDPGPLFKWDHLEALITGAVPIPAPTPNSPTLPTPDMQAWTDPATGCHVVGGMLARFKQLQAALATITPGEVLLVVGHPTGNERVDPDGVTRQNFEHVTLTWKAHQSPDRFDILEETINPYQGGH